MPDKFIPATELTANDATSQEELGRTRLESDGKEYRYIQMKNGTGKTGNTVVFNSSNNYQVTRSASTARRSLFAGVLLGTLRKDRYGWAQIRGYCTHVKTDTSVAAGHAVGVGVVAVGLCSAVSSAGALRMAFGASLKADSGSIATAVKLVG